MDDEEVYEDDQQRFEAEVQQWQQQEQHEDEQMLTRKDFLNELVKKNHLVEEDIFALPLGGKKVHIIARTGIEKIQYINSIIVKFEDKVLTPDYVVMKAIATIMPLDDMYAPITIETYANAKYGKKPEGNTTFPYIVEIAEKRALARAVLKICGAYRYGIFGEDESEDFKRKPSHHTDFSEDSRGPDTKQYNEPSPKKKAA
jgi:hypothetical protein